jgi:hypothetical protein
MPSIFRIFQNGRYETSVKKQTVTAAFAPVAAAFAPVAAAVVCSSPLSLHNEEERDERDERQGTSSGRQVCGRSSQQAQ